MMDDSARTSLARQKLREVFGFDDYRPLQQEIVESVLSGRDTVVVMPTGGGKSLCFQLPALVFEGLTVVVSPLISLMHDQVLHLDSYGARAVLLNSSLDRESYSANLGRVRRGDVDLLYLAPETLMKGSVLDLLMSVRVDCLAIDEAHCISDWGHDFRPEYRELADVRHQIGAGVCIALTATATPRVREDIARNMHLRDSLEFVASFDRPNLTLGVADKDNARAQTRDFVDRFAGESGIIYCGTRAGVEDLAADLAKHGCSVLPYHAGLNADTRRSNQERFIHDDVRIIVATVAFGMGIDKPDVRFVMHYDLPKSLESYYQEIGRAGRDGLPAECLLLYGLADANKIQYFISQKTDPQEQRVGQTQLSQMLAYGESTACRRRPLLAYFGETYGAETCGACDRCLDPPELVDITLPARKLLSCIYRTGERFGAGHVVDVLRGSSAQKVLKFGHDRLSTYNIGQELARNQWMHLARHLVQRGLIVQDVHHGGMSLSEAAGPVLRGHQSLEGIITKAGKPKSRDKKRPPIPEDCDQALFGQLRKLRKELADANGVPPYVVFNDKTLHAMAAQYPRTRGAMLATFGVGEGKLNRWGDAFMAEITTYCEENGHDPPPPESVWEPDPDAEPKKKKKKKKPKKPARHMVVGEALAAGESLRALAATGKANERTLISYARKYIAAGHHIDPQVFLDDSTLSEPDQQEALAAFEAQQTHFLRPVFDALDERVTYDELALIQLAWLASRPGSGDP